MESHPESVEFNDFGDGSSVRSIIRLGGRGISRYSSVSLFSVIVVNVGTCRFIRIRSFAISIIFRNSYTNCTANKGGFAISSGSKKSAIIISSCKYYLNFSFETIRFRKLSELQKHDPLIWLLSFSVEKVFLIYRT